MNSLDEKEKFERRYAKRIRILSDKADRIQKRLDELNEEKREVIREIYKLRQEMDYYICYI